MGKSDALGKKLMQNNDYFADAFNAGLFDGRTVVNPENLHSLEPDEIEIGNKETGADEVWNKSRDVIKELFVKTDGKSYYVLLGVENQSRVHTAMPLRSLMYDTFRYLKQARDVDDKYKKARKNGFSPKMTAEEFLSSWKYTDRLTPVITLVIYYGSDEWNGAMSLHDMFSEDIDPGILKYVPDYHINLIQPSKMQDFDKFKSDFGTLMESIRYKDDEKELIKLFHEKPEVDPLIGEAIGYYVDKRWCNAANVVEGGKWNMSRAADAIEARGEARGIAKGRLSKGVETVQNMIRKFHVSLEEACETANISVEDYKKYTSK